jgi:hypothetical protein
MEAQGYTFAVAFHAPIRLDRKRGHDLAASFSGSGLISPEQTQITDEGWRFAQSLGEKGGVSIQIGPQQIVFQAVLPAHRREWFETRYRGILERFGGEYKPQMLMQSMASLQATLPIDGDARTFIFENFAHVDAATLKDFGRPIQVCGLRMGFPPFQIQGDERGKRPKKDDSADWGLELKIESMAEDSSRLWLSAEGTWPIPGQWDEVAVGQAVGRLQTLNDFLVQKVIPGLTKKGRGTSA